MYKQRPKKLNKKNSATAGGWLTLPQQFYKKRTKVRTHAHMQSWACPWTVWHKRCLTTHHFCLLGIQQRASPIRDDDSHSAKVKISLILALPTRKSLWWSKASQRPPSQEWKDARQRKELFWLGVEKATSGDCKIVFPSQATQRQCCSLSLEGRSDFMITSKTTQEAKSKMLTRRLSAGLMRDRGQRRDGDAQRAPSVLLIWTSTCTTRHEHTCEHVHQGSHMVTLKKTGVHLWFSSKSLPPPSKSWHWKKKNSHGGS